MALRRAAVPPWVMPLLLTIAVAWSGWQYYAEKDGRTPGEIDASYDKGDHPCMEPDDADDHAKVFADCTALAKAGSLPAKVMLGKLYEFGRGVAPDYARAEELYLEVRNAQSRMSGVAAWSLGDLYSRPDFEKRDDEAATRWYREAADKGQSDAQMQYGVRLIQGLGVAVNADLGRDYIKRAADAGNPRAKALAKQIAELDNL